MSDETQSTPRWAGYECGGGLHRIASERSMREAIVLDNEPEFRGRTLAAWSEERRVRLEFIQPGKPATSHRLCLIE